MAASTILIGGCASDEPRRQDRPGEPVVHAQRAPATGPLVTTASAVTASGDGIVRDETPPQRRYRIIGGGSTRMRVVEEPNVLSLPGAERPTPIPEPEPAEPPPSPSEAPPLVEIHPPR